MLTLADIVEFDIQFGSGGPGVNPYSAFGLRGRLTPIKEAQGEDKLARTVNGGVVDLSAPQMRKYQLEISANSPSPPALDGLWVGMPVGVSCVTELSVGPGFTFSRTPVGGSERTEGEYTFYRPFLNMQIVSWDIERDDWTGDVRWQLVLTES